MSANSSDAEVKDTSSDTNDVIKRLNDSSLEPDRDIDSLASSTTSADETSLTRTSSTTSSQKELVTAQQDDTTDSNETSTDKAAANPKSPGEGGFLGKLIKNPFSSFKKKSQKEREKAEQAAKFEKMLAAVHIDRLPQVFVTKYVGFKPTKGLYGVKFTRAVAEELISSIDSNEKQQQLPLTQLHVSLRGIHVSEHKENKAKPSKCESGLIPLEFISYGVQDIRYTKVFTFIVVKEMSSKSRTLECHAYLCDSSVTCRKLALSLSLAFQEYGKTMEGKQHKFKVDLRPFREIDQDFTKQDKEEGVSSNPETEFDA